jgi:hypothetical protein
VVVFQAKETLWVAAWATEKEPKRIEAVPMPNRERRKSDQGLKAKEEGAQEESRSFVMLYYSSNYDNYK